MAFSLKSFLVELKRRKVYHVAVAYGAVGLAVLGAAEVILDPLGLTDLRPVIVVLTLLGFPLALVLAWAYEVTPEGRAPDAASPGATESRRASSAQKPVDHERERQAALADKSIAVLPFDDLSPDGDQEYFVHGLSEEIINALTQVEDLKVAARTSTFVLARRDADIAAVADALGVANVLEGSVRKAGDRIRITAQLIEADSGFHLWSDTFDRELTDIFQIQDEIARAITRRLEVTLAPKLQQHLVSEATENREAYDAYLRGRYLQVIRNSESFRRAMKEFERAIELDPGYAEAHAGLAECYLLVDGYTPVPESPHFRENLERGLAAARTAVSIGPDVGAAHLALGMALWSAGDWEGGPREMQRAVDMNPGNAMPHMGLGVVAGSLGSPSEALEHTKKAARLDPVSPVVAFNLAFARKLCGQLGEAVTEFRKTLELGPGLWNAWFLLSATLFEAERHDEGSDAWGQLGRVLRVEDAQTWRGLYQAAIRWRETGEAQSLPEPEWTAPVMNLIWVCAHTGHPECAIDFFEEYLMRQGAYGWAAITHRVAGGPLADHPRYQALLEKASIPR
jgi:adenylate cyclase